jgi:hypothetical protein
MAGKHTPARPRPVTWRCLIPRCPEPTGIAMGGPPGGCEAYTAHYREHHLTRTPDTTPQEPHRAP